MILTLAVTGYTVYNECAINVPDLSKVEVGTGGKCLSQFMYDLATMS